MITIYLKNSTIETRWFVTLPHEINNEFLGNAGRAAREGKISGVLDVPSFGDFGSVEFPPEKLDQLYHDFDILETHLNEIIQVIPLPKIIGGWEWYNKSFVFFYKEGVNEFIKYFPYFSTEEVTDIVNHENMIQKPTPFTPSDMLLIISLIKKKILEAKEKNETLVFSGD